mgnify:CR=1 FL=1
MATTARPALRWRNDRLFYTGMGVALALVTFWGFYRSYYLTHWHETPPGLRDLNQLLHVHGAVFTGWILLNIVQPALIAAGNRTLHRRLGWAGAALAVLMVVLGLLAGIEAMQRPPIPGFGDPHAFFSIVFFALVTFAIIVALAIRYRKHAETHKRLMLLSSTQIIEAAVARIPVDAIFAYMPASFYIGANFVIVAGIGYDLLSRGKVHKVWLIGGAAVLASQVLRLVVMETEIWLAFARFLASLW